jgi:hypothetical protein
MRIIGYIVIAWFLTYNIFAQELYYSDEYEIKFKSENIKLKKEEFISTIKYISFKKLINSLLTDYEYERFNNVITIDLINNFLFSLNINEEKINNKNYSSKIQLTYDNSKIINYFINNNINFIPYDPEKFLIIIFDQKLFSEKILSKENKFYEYLFINNLYYELFVAPNLDINDRYIVKKEDFLLKKIQKYEELVNKYKYKNILLVHSISDLNGVNINSYVYKNDNFLLIDNIYFSKINYELFFNNLHNKVLNYWKNNNIVHSSKINNITCRIKTLNLIELKKIKEIIINNNIIKKINAETIAYNNSTYNLVFYGNLNILISSLYKDKLELKSYNDKCSIKIL